MCDVTFQAARASATVFDFNSKPFRTMTLRHLIPALILSVAVPAFARLGETEAQSQTRYGAPVEGLVGSDEKPLMAGAVERVYNFDSWRVRAAFVGGATVRIQYVHIENGAPQKFSDAEMQALFEAEKGKFKWREERPKSAGIAKDIEKAIKAGFGINKWERTDHAKAELVLGLAMQFETREAEALEKKLAKQLPAVKPGATPVVPKF